MDPNPSTNTKRQERSRAPTAVLAHLCDEGSSTLHAVWITGGQTLHEHKENPLRQILSFSPRFPWLLNLSVGLAGVPFLICPLKDVSSCPNMVRYGVGNFWTTAVGNLPVLGILSFLPSVWATNAVCNSNWEWVRTFYIPQSRSDIIVDYPFPAVLQFKGSEPVRDSSVAPRPLFRRAYALIIPNFHSST